MDNNELDKILKEKLKGKICPSKELEDKIKSKVKEQQRERIIQKESVGMKKSQKEPAQMKKILSVAAMLVIIFTVGVFVNRNESGDNTEFTGVTIKTIEPTKLESGILANDSEFLIYAQEENSTIESVQKSIYVDPPLDYTIEKTKNSNEYKLKFKQNIPDNTILKLQYVKNKITENSWAYQTSNKLSVNKIYPEDGANTVSTNSAIEIEFSYASVENIDKYVEVSPNIQGKWKHNGKKWRIIPDKSLEKNTKYTVKVKSGIVAEDQTLEKDYVFQFATYDEGSGEHYEVTSITVDGMFTYKTDEAVKIYYDYYGTENAVSKVEISKFDTADEFIQYLNNRTYENAKSQGEVEFNNINGENYNNCIQLTKNLLNGYYVASVQNSTGKELFNCPIQINDLSVYAMESERDVIAWVASDGDLAKNINVEYQGKTQKTNNNGIAQFEDVADGSETVKYMKVGNTDNQQFVIGVYNYNTENYPEAYIYTDRLLYKNTDTINIWGFVPRTFFYDNIEDEFYIELNNEGKQKVKVEEDGNLNYKIDLNNHTDDDYAKISLYYKDTEIGCRIFEIKNYELQNYTYEPVLDKRYVYVGEKLDFGVKVNHITGLVVANKTVKISYNGQEYSEKTGEDGIAHFTLDIELDNGEEVEIGNSFRSGVNEQYIYIYNGDTEEYTEDDDCVEIYALSRNTYTEIKQEGEKYNVSLYKLAKNNNITTTEGDISEMYDGVYDTDVTINLIENVSTRNITGYEYNEYTKENDPIYEWETTENTIKIKTVKTENGNFEINANTLSYKKDTEENSYYYELEFVYKDGNGNEVRDTAYIEKYELYQPTELGYYYTNYDNYEYLPSKVNEQYYNVYRYLLKKDTNKFSIGDTLEFSLAESTNDGIKDIQNNGKILRIVFQEDLSKIDLIEDNNLNYTFTDEDFPGCKITSAYFVNGKFYRMPIYYFDFDEEDRKVDIEIKSDKEEYKPGDEVNLTIKTTNNGNPIKSFVNISVVNEAVFELANTAEYQDTSLVATIYRSKNYPGYTFSSYNDWIRIGDGGGAGGGPEARNNFGDTACFETVYTDKNGNATVKFKLPDNVTTYRVTAQSANKDCYLGINTIDITSKLDFFVQSTEPRKVKTTDDLVLNATSIAEESYDVEFEFTIKELNKTLTATAKTNNLATVNFGKLKPGKYHALISGKYGEQTDAIEYEFEIVESAQEVKDKKTVNINSDVKINPTKNPVTLEIYNKNMSQYLEYIDFIESTISARLDTRISYNVVQNIKEKYYGTKSYTNSIDMADYMGDAYLKNLKNGNEDLLLTALVKYFATDYFYNSYVAENNGLDIEFNENINLFEYYLYAAACNEPVLLDLQYLKEEKDIDNYNKLLLTLSFEFLGDYQNAKQLYNGLNLTSEEKEEYASIIALIDTFINKDRAVTEIDNLIENKPSDEYLRFAIISFFENNSTEIGKEDTVKITSKNLNDTITINGMEVKTYTIYNNDLDTISFETSSQDLMVSYYYQTSLEEIENNNIKQNIKINLDGELKKNNTVTLVAEFEDTSEGEVRIALPNSLRLSQNYSDIDKYEDYYLNSNNIDYVTLYKYNGCNRIELPLIVTLDGNYIFENVVCFNEGTYGLSNSFEFNVKK